MSQFELFRHQANNGFGAAESWQLKMWSTKHQSWAAPVCEVLASLSARLLIAWLCKKMCCVFADCVFRWSMFTPLLEVCDSEGAFTVRIQGSYCPCRCFSNQQFQVIFKKPQIKHLFLRVFHSVFWLLFIHQVVSNIGEKIGTIWKKCPTPTDEHNMDHDFFGLEGELSLRKADILFLKKWFPHFFCHVPL